MSDNFCPQFDAYEPSLRDAHNACRQFADACVSEPQKQRAADPFDAALRSVSVGLPTKWLTLSGANGCGKTMLARHIHAQVARHYPYATGPRIAGHGCLSSRRPEVVWIDEVSFVNRCKNGEYDLPEYLGDDWLVVLDDLGASRDKTGFVGEMLFKLCNARIGKFTLFTTNLELQDIAERIDVRITSRLIRDGNKFMRVKAGDYAMRKPAA